MEDLDYHFLRYIGVNREGQRRIQSFHLPFFEGCQRVLDLGCGDGDFVEMLGERGIAALGVDRDAACCREAARRGVEVVCQDLFEYLRGLEEESVDGIFASHLVEHLTYREVMELLSLARRALTKGGRILLTTPNVRGLYSHLEMFYLHFDHVTFYHPRLLCFFLEHTGYSQVEMGENPETAFPLWGQLTSRPSQGSGSLLSPLQYDPLLPLPSNPLRRVIWRGKMFLVRLIVQPYLDRIVEGVNAGLRQISAALERVDTKLEHLDRPFECYARGRKPG
jgi:O-antigen chain-terminating methyltransferase